MMRVTCAAILLIVVSATASCSPEVEEGGASAGGAAGSNVSDALVFDQSCKEAKNVVSLGSTSPDNDAETESFLNLETLKSQASIPDGISKLSAGQGTRLIDLDTLSERQNAQLWESYLAYVAAAGEYDTESIRIFVYGEPSQELVEEYNRGDGWPQSLTDGVIDSPDLNLCVAGGTAIPTDSENWVS